MAVFSEAAEQEEVAGWGPGPATASGQTAAARLSSVVTQLLVSPDDHWAALVTPRVTHLYDLSALKYHGRLPVFEVRCLVLCPGPPAQAACPVIDLWKSEHNIVILATDSGKSGRLDESVLLYVFAHLSQVVLQSSVPLGELRLMLAVLHFLKVALAPSWLASTVSIEATIKSGAVCYLSHL